MGKLTVFMGFPYSFTLRLYGRFQTLFVFHEEWNLQA